MPYKGLRPFKGRFFMAIATVVLFLSGGSVLKAQKRSVRTFDATTLTKLEIDAEKIFEVILEESTGDLLQAEVAIEGEYQQEMTLGVKTEGSTLFLKGLFLPTFEDPNDKLSAHKVLSVRLKLKIPHHLMVSLTGLSTRVVATGYFEDLQLRTAKGPVVLNRPEGMIHVRTTGGMIKASQCAGFVSATSSYGHVYRGTLPEGRSTLILRSVSGDIYMNKHE